MLKLIDYQPHDRQQALQTAVEAIAEYLATWGHKEERGRGKWAVAVPTGLLDDIQCGVEDRLMAKWDEASREQALDFKADELGIRY